MEGSKKAVANCRELRSQMDLAYILKKIKKKTEVYPKKLDIEFCLVTISQKTQLLIMLHNWGLPPF